MEEPRGAIRGVFAGTKRIWPTKAGQGTKPDLRNDMCVSDDNPAIVHQRVFEELRNLEPIFHYPELGTSEADYQRMTDSDFWEVGASGRIYDRRDVIEILLKRYSEPFEDVFRLDGCKCRQLSQDIWLFTYTLHQGDRVSRRATIWRRSEDDWKIVYHQGTLVSDG
jgi:hypothetical protein